jgi:hypothetical protein
VAYVRTLGEEKFMCRRVFKGTPRGGNDHQAIVDLTPEKEKIVLV